MVSIELPSDFKDFLQILNSHEVEYLLIGGYAVGYYGYIRTTGDMDVWLVIYAMKALCNLCGVDHDFGHYARFVVYALACRA